MGSRRNSEKETGPLGTGPLVHLLKQGQAAVPAVKYAIGVVGIAAAAGIANIILGHTRASLVSIALMIGAMIVLFVFSRLVASGASTSVKIAANVLLWVVVSLFSAGLILSLTAIAFGVPKGMHDFLLPEKEMSNAELIKRVMLKDSVEDSREAMSELGKRCSNNCSDRAKIIEAILYSLRRTTRVERDLKITAIEVLRKVSGNNLSDILSDEFDKAHIVEINFTRTNLSRISFRSSFAILNNFSFADLSETNFSGAYLRGSDFKNARLFRAKMNGADWFNGLNLSIDQLRDAEGLAKCPSPYSDTTYAAFITANDDRYVYNFAQYSPDHQEELKENWKRYASPGGACEMVASR